MTEAAAWQQAQRCYKEVETALQAWLRTRDEDNEIELHFSASDQLRLLNLRLWSMIYYLPIVDILDLILPKLREQVDKHARCKRKGSRRGLGVRVAGLVGAGAEKILIERMGRWYPGGENIFAWQQRTRDEQLAAEGHEEKEGLVSKIGGLSLLDYSDTGAFLAAYRKRVTRNQDKLFAEEDNKERRRKHYRNNPWL